MAWGISPYRSEVVPLDEYNPDFYLTLIYHAIENLGWHVGYFDHDGIIAYTNISWSSYAEEISVRIINHTAVIKSECVGYQGLFTDYGKNQRNLDLLFPEIEYIHFHLQHNLEESAQELMDAIPEKQFLSLSDPPMAGKETLRGFFSVFVPKPKYFVTPILVLVNIAVYIITAVAMALMFSVALKSNDTDLTERFRSIYLFIGFNGRSQVLNGQVWRLFTNTFLHFSLLHVTGNMIALIYIGSLIESKLGRLNYLLLYLFTGIIASMVSVIWRADGISGGASGAIMGLFGILLALASTDFYESSARRALLISTAIVVFINVVPLGRGVDHAAHFGGLIAGYVFGLITYFSFKNRNLFMQKWGSPAIACLIMVAFVYGGISLTPNYQLKDFERLINQTETTMEDINHYFYSEDSLSREQKLDTLDQKALPELKLFSKLSTDFTALRLPAAKKKEAGFRSQLIVLECHFYKLLYLEFKEHNKTKYRPEINKTTDRINEVREKWGELDQDN